VACLGREFLVKKCASPPFDRKKRGPKNGAPEHLGRTTEWEMGHPTRERVKTGGAGSYISKASFSECRPYGALKVCGFVPYPDGWG
jgi:hypothetical protein